VRMATLKTKDIVIRTKDITVQVKIPKMYRLRVYVGFFFLRLGCRCIGCKFVVGDL